MSKIKNEEIKEEVINKEECCCNGEHECTCSETCECDNCTCNEDINMESGEG